MGSSLNWIERAANYKNKYHYMRRIISIKPPKIACTRNSTSNEPLTICNGFERQGRNEYVFFCFGFKESKQCFFVFIVHTRWSSDVCACLRFFFFENKKKTACRPKRIDDFVASLLLHTGLNTESYGQYTQYECGVCTTYLFFLSSLVLFQVTFNDAVKLMLDAVCLLFAICCSLLASKYLIKLEISKR